MAIGITEIGALVAAAGGLVSAWIAIAKNRRENFALEEQLLQRNRQLYDDIERLRRDIQASENARQEEAASKHNCLEEVHEVKEELERLRDLIERYIPLAQAEKRIRDLKSLARVFEAVPMPLVVTKSEGGGTFVWANRLFLQAMGMKREDLKNFDWRAAVHPSDLPATATAEALAWEMGGNLRTSYRTADGHLVVLLWTFSNYIDGTAIAVAKVLSRVPQPKEDTPRLEDSP